MAPLNHDDNAYSSDDSAHSTIIFQDGFGSRKSRVSFSTVEIREYERVVGDHPDTKVGPPMAIGWAFAESEVSMLDDYESDRLSTRKGTRRMSSITRKNILKNVFAIPEEEIRMAEKEVQKIFLKRVKTSNQGKVAEKVEEGLETIGRRLKRTFSKERLWKGLVESQRMFPTMMVN